MVYSDIPFVDFLNLFISLFFNLPKIFSYFSYSGKYPHITKPTYNLE